MSRLLRRVKSMSSDEIAAECHDDYRRTIFKCYGFKDAMNHKRRLGAELRTYCNRGEILKKIEQILKYNRSTIAAWFLEPKA